MTSIFPKITLLDKPATPDCFGLSNSPIGYFLVAWQGHLLVRLTLLPAHLETELAQIIMDYHLPFDIEQDNARAKKLVMGQLFNKHEWRGEFSEELKIGFHGTEFQTKIMKHMIKIPKGQTLSYGALAAKAGSGGASRAVGSICARNPVAFIVPRHRVLASNGLGGYGYGPALKRQFLAWENMGEKAAGTKW